MGRRFLDNRHSGNSRAAEPASLHECQLRDPDLIRLPGFAEVHSGRCPVPTIGPAVPDDLVNAGREAAVDEHPHQFPPDVVEPEIDLTGTRDGQPDRGPWVEGVGKAGQLD